MLFNYRLSILGSRKIIKRQPEICPSRAHNLNWSCLVVELDGLAYNKMNKHVNILIQRLSIGLDLGLLSLSISTRLTPKYTHRLNLKIRDKTRIVHTRLMNLFGTAAKRPILK